MVQNQFLGFLMSVLHLLLSCITSYLSKVFILVCEVFNNLLYTAHFTICVRKQFMF